MGEERREGESHYSPRLYRVCERRSISSRRSLPSDRRSVGTRGWEKLPANGMGRSGLPRKQVNDSGYHPEELV